MGNYADARRALSQSLIARQQLVTENPRNAQARRDVAIAHYLLCGQLHAQKGDTATALLDYGRAMSYYDTDFGGKRGALNDRRDVAEAQLERAELAAYSRTSRDLAMTSLALVGASNDSIAATMALTARNSTDANAIAGRAAHSIVSARHHTR